MKEMVTPYLAKELVNSIVSDVMDMNLLNYKSVFPVDRKEKNLIKFPSFQESGPLQWKITNSGAFFVFLGECSIYHCIYGIDFADSNYNKVYIPDHRVLEVNNLIKDIFGDFQKSHFLIGYNRRIMSNVVSVNIVRGGDKNDFPICVFKDGNKGVYEMGVVDLSYYFVSRYMFSDPLFKKAISGKALVEMWSIKSERYRYRKNHYKIWEYPDFLKRDFSFLIQDKGRFYIDSYLRKRMSEADDNWKEIRKKIIKKCKKIKVNNNSN